MLCRGLFETKGIAWLVALVAVTLLLSKPVHGQYPSSNPGMQQPDPRLAFPTAAQIGTNNPLPPPIVTQPSGQRVFTQQDPPTTPANPGQTPTQSGTFRDRSSVQPASWNTPVSASSQAKSKSEPIEFRAPSKDAQIERPRSTWSALLSMLFSLGIVLSLFLMVAWLYKKSQPATQNRLPKEVVQFLGRTTLSPRQQVFVVRFGNKMLLVNQQQGQMQTLSEIDDPNEVDRIATLCEASQPTSISHSFRDVLQNVVSGKPDHADHPPQKRRSSLAN